MDVSFSVSMMLQSVNNMAPGIQGAQRMLQGLGQTVRSVAAMGRGSSPVQGWDEKIRKTVAEMKALQNQVEKVEASAGKMRNNGLEQVATGAGIALPVMGLVHEAADRERAMMVLSQAGMGDADRAAVNSMARELSSELMFSQNELLSIPLAMQRAGMNAEKIKASFQQTAYLSELEHLRNGAGAAETAKNFASMAEQVQATSDPEKLKDFAEAVNRVATVTSASISTLAESTKYFAPVAKMYGLDNKDIMLTQGFMARYGIEGSMAGTHLKDFLDRLNPEQFLKSSGKSQQLEAMQQLGFLNDAQFAKTKTGGLKFTDVGDSAFFRDGKVKPILEVFELIGEKYKEILAADPEHGLEKFAGAMKHIFGEQGKDVAMIAAQNHEAFMQMLTDYNRVKRIDDSIREFQQTFSQTFSALKTNLLNIGVDAVEDTMRDLTGTMKEITPYVNEFAKWAGENKGLVTGIVQATLGVAAFLITLGAVQIVLGTIGKLMFGGLRFAMAPLQWILRFALALVNVRTIFIAMRGLGFGFWGSLLGGAQTTWPWLIRIGGAISTLGRLCTVFGLKAAAAWFVALGPIGWAIGAFLAVMLAWQTDFLGLRSVIDEACSYLIGKLQQLIDKIYELLGLSGKMKEIEKGAKEMGYNTPGGVGDTSYSNDTPMVPTYGADNTPRVDGGSGSDTFSPQVTINNNVSVNSAEEAGEYVAGSVPDKYLRSRDPAFGGV